MDLPNEPYLAYNPSTTPLEYNFGSAIWGIILDRISVVI